MDEALPIYRWNEGLIVPSKTKVNSTAAGGKKILVLGDWVIDDDWVVDTHESDTSSVVGEEHVRALHHPAGAVRRLGGVGLVANQLFVSTHGTEGASAPPKLAGLGIWNKHDDKFLLSMFRPEGLMGHTPLQLTSVPDASPNVDLKLFNFGAVVEFLPHDPPFSCVESGQNLQYYKAGKENYYGTSRILRIFKQSGSKIVQRLRLDWESRVPETARGRTEWIDRQSLSDSQVGSIKKRILDYYQAAVDWLGGEVDAIILKDLGKGMVSDLMVECLVEVVEKMDCDWYVYSKEWQPTWLTLLVERKQFIRARLVPEVATRKCASVPTWVTSDGTMSKSAIQALDGLSSAIRVGSRPGRTQWVIVVVDDLQVIGVELSLGTRSVYVHRDKNPNNMGLEVGVGKNSALLSAAIYGLLHAERIAEYCPHGEQGRLLFENSLCIAQFWMAAERRRLMRASSPEYPIVLRLRLKEWNDKVAPGKTDEGGSRRLIDVINAGGEPQQLKEVGRIQMYPDLLVQIDNWKAATSKHGIIVIQEAEKQVGDGSESDVVHPDRRVALAVFEPWRAWTEIDGYACLSSLKLAQIASLESEISSFDPSVATRSKAGLIMAGPGSGKSHLVHRLAESSNLYRLEFNITTLMKREGLIDCFDQIVTWQAQHRGARLIVFVDEINAELENHCVYDIFLAPLEDGYYLRSGRKYLIQPCIWLFAGTDSTADIEAKLKGPDFVSRMSLTHVNLTHPPEASEDPERLLETVYIGVTLARREYPGLQGIKAEVFALLRSLKPQALTLRHLRQIIDKHLLVSRGVARWRDLERLKAEHGSIINTASHDANVELLASRCIETVYINDDPHTDYAEFRK